MLCSKCSERVHPILAIDVDGTMGMYHRHFLRFASYYWNRHVPPVYDGSVPLHTFLGVTKEEYRACKLAYRQGGQKRSMPIHDGAQMLVQRMNAVHVEIWITTTRPYMRLDNVDPDTREWLRRYGLEPYAGLLYDEDKYGRLTELVDKGRIIGVLEDEPAQYDRASELGLSPLLVARTHNTLSQFGRHTVPNLHVAKTLLMTRVKQWEEHHAERA